MDERVQTMLLTKLCTSVGSDMSLHKYWICVASLFSHYPIWQCANEQNVWILCESFILKSSDVGRGDEKWKAYLSEHNLAYNYMVTMVSLGLPFKRRILPINLTWDRKTHLLRTCSETYLALKFSIMAREAWSISFWASPKRRWDRLTAYQRGTAMKIIAYLIKRESQ